MPSQVSIVDLPGGEGGKAGDGAAKSSSAKSPRGGAAKQRANDSDLKSRLVTVLDRIIDNADARGDEELSEILREDRDVIANGIVSFTRPFMVLRTPILLLLAVVEPVMSFWRIGGLMVGRVLYNRAARRAEGPGPGDGND